MKGSRTLSGIIDRVEGVGHGLDSGVRLTSLRAEHKPITGHLLPAEAFEGFNGLVLVFESTGALRSAMPDDAPLCLAARSAASEDLTAAVDLVLSAGLARQVSIQVESNSGTHHYDLTLFPLGGGGVMALGREVTLYNNLRLALVESRQRYKDFVDISSDFAWETGPDGQLIFVSPRGALGHAAAELVGRDPSELVLEQDAGIDLPFHARTPVDGTELWLRRADGGASCMAVSAKPVFDRDGLWVGTRGVCRDVTSDREREAQLARARNRERILNHIVRTFRDEVDPKNMLRVAAETLARGMGAESCQVFRRAADALYGPDGPDGLPWKAFMPGARYGGVDNISAVPVLERLDTGEELVEAEILGRLVLAVPTRYRQRVNGAIVLWRYLERGAWGDDDRLLITDIADQVGIANEQIAAHEDIVRLSRTDGLTGLFNRRAFFEELERRFKRLARDRSYAALMYVDLDNFKMVNDRHGHAEGDEVLCVVRDMLLSHTRPTDLVARLGGDEFAVWLEGGDAKVAEDKARILLDLSDRELLKRSGEPQSPLGLSIGIAVYDPRCSETLEEMIARADSAMYRVKHEEKGNYAIAAPYPTPSSDADEEGGVA